MEPSSDACDRMLCPCTQCKYQIFRKQKVCEDHVQKSGTFPQQESMHDLHFNSFSMPTCNEGASERTNATDIRPQVRRRTSESIRGEMQTTVPNTLLEEHAMDEMLESFYEHNVEDVANADIDALNERAADVRSNNEQQIGRHIENKEERM